MTLTNFHTHTRFSDGSEEPGKYLEEAVKQNFTLLGFSDHAPVPFKNTFAIKSSGLDDYFKAISSLKNTTSVQVLTGLEFDFIPGITVPAADFRTIYHPDYLIGSVHLVKNPDNGQLWFIDGPDISIYDEGLKSIFGNDTKKAVTAYYRQLQEMISTEKPDIIGHMDKIKMYNRDRFFKEDEKWYIDLMEETLQLAKYNNCIIEINTRGLYKKRSASLFPGEPVIKRIAELDIPVIISSDAHKPHEISLFFEEAKQILKQSGIKKVVTGISRETALI